MKKLLCLLLTIILISLTGCGSSNVDNNTDILVNEAGSEEKNASEMQEPMENTGEEVTELEETAPETKYISIDLLEAEEIHAEGDAVEPLKLKILSEEKNGINWAGTEEIKDEIRYIYSDAYGLDDPREILIYLPGMPIEELPEGYLSWVRNNWFMDSEFTKTETKLPFYGLYNANSEQGFSSYDIFEELKETVDFTEEWVESLESSIMNDNLSQAEMNEKSQLMYEFWDGQLNKAWRILKENLDADTMKVLTQEQLDWIAMKEASMKEAGAEVEGGSMYSMVVNQREAELTKERVYELMEIVDDCIK